MSNFHWIFYARTNSALIYSLYLCENKNGGDITLNITIDYVPLI